MAARQPVILNTEMKRLIIDCDPGNGVPGANVDDGLAIALALSSPEISLELITTVAGNTPSTLGYSVAQDLLTRSGLQVPVVKGADQALEEPAAPWRQLLDRRVHDKQLNHLWQGVTPPASYTPPAQDAADAIGELICANPGEITLVAIGPLTNVARALQRYPHMASCVKEIAIMGGVFALDDFVKDTNFGVDPEAAHQVLTSGANITLVPMDVTSKTMMTHQDLDRIAALSTPLAEFISETLRPWIDYSMLTRHLPGCWIHDALVVAWLINPQLVSFDYYYVDVEIRPGITRGKSWRFRAPLRIDVGITLPQNAPVRVLNNVDNALLLAILEQNLAILPAA